MTSDKRRISQKKAGLQRGAQSAWMSCLLLKNGLALTKKRWKPEKCEFQSG